MFRVQRARPAPPGLLCGLYLTLCIAAGPPLVLPELRLYELDGKPGFLTLPLREVVGVVSQADVAAAVLAASKAGSARGRRLQQQEQGGELQGAEDDWVPELQEEQQEEQQDQGGGEAGQDGRRGSGRQPTRALWRLRVLEAAVAVRPSVTLTNWFHTMDGEQSKVGRKAFGGRWVGPI